MIFKLIRIDAEEPSKIALTVGTHLFGRGKFLNCDDKRVSRKHGELTVTGDSVVLKALHHNPCFYIQKGSKEKQILKENCIRPLNNGDQFGLLPDSYWYEVLLCQSFDSDIPDVNSNQINDRVESSTQDRTQLNESQELLNLNVDDTTERAASPLESREALALTPRGLNCSPEEQVSPSILPAGQDLASELPSVDPGPAISPSYTQPDSPGRNSSPSMIGINQSPTRGIPQSDTQVAETSKRRHSQDCPIDVKKVKTEPMEVKAEPVEVKQEPVQVKQDPDVVQPGPSRDQNAPNNGAGGAMPQSPIKPPGPGRERCIYGAQCYRKNPEHKATFSHPTDSDWGSGEHGVCPWGARCRRHDPRHWKTHTHPPGTVPPQPHDMQMVQRHGNIFFINASVVNFYDDHFEVEDSDGLSVDHDYEF